MKVKLYQYPRGANKGGILQGDICPTISTSSWENNCFLIECNMDGLKQNHKRRELSPSDHNASSIVNVEGIAPTVMENHGTITAIKEQSKNIDPICLNSKVDGKQPSLQDRVYDIEGIATACTTSFHPNVLIRQDGLGATGVLYIPQATKQGYAEVEVGVVFDAAYPESKTRRGRVQENGTISPTLCTSNELCVFEGESRRDDEDWKTVVGNKQMNPFRGSVENEAPCITSACGAGGGMTPMITDAELVTTKTKEFIEQMRGHKPLEYRIRKLTPRECFRLMDVTESDIDKIQNTGLSESQQYKLAGNSIVVACMEGIFRNLFSVEQEYPKSGQLQLF